MRFFDIQIGGDIPIRYTSWVGGRNDPGAVRVELDIGVTAFATPFQNSKVRIYGAGIKQIGSATQLNGAPISVYAGMKPGLPIATKQANDGQAGLIAQGVIFQPYGNWIGTMQSLDLPMVPGAGGGKDVTAVDAYNLVLSWKQGQPIGPAIETCLQTAFPGSTVDIQVQQNVVWSQDYVAKFPSLGQMAADLKSISAQIVNGGPSGAYGGIDILATGSGFLVFDGPPPDQQAKAISFVDLIGQPTWIEFPQIQFTTAMRADLTVGSTITLPQGQYQTASSGSFSALRSQTSQVGSFQVVAAHHVGDSRGPGAESWTSVFNAIPLTS